MIRPLHPDNIEAIAQELTLSRQEGEQGDWVPLADMQAELVAAAAEFGPKKRTKVPETSP